MREPNYSFQSQYGCATSVFTKHRQNHLPNGFSLISYLCILFALSKWGEPGGFFMNFVVLNKPTEKNMKPVYFHRETNLVFRSSRSLELSSVRIQIG